MDFAGRIPTAEETRAFLADASPDKRERHIDRLLADPAYAALEPSLSGLLPRADVTVRHAYPPALGPVHGGRVAQFLHWEYGAPPLGWVASTNR